MFCLWEVLYLPGLCSKLSTDFHWINKYYSSPVYSKSCLDSVKLSFLSKIERKIKDRRLIHTQYNARTAARRNTHVFTCWMETRISVQNETLPRLCIHANETHKELKHEICRISKIISFGNIQKQAECAT